MRSSPYTYRRLAFRYKDTAQLVRDLSGQKLTNNNKARLRQEIDELNDYYRKVIRKRIKSHQARNVLLTTGNIGVIVSGMALYRGLDTITSIIMLLVLGLFLACIYNGLKISVEKYTVTQEKNISDFITMISQSLERWITMDFLDERVANVTFYDIEKLIQYIENR